MNAASAQLVGLSEGQLQALAAGILIPSAQARLDELLAANAEGRISPQDQHELDHILDRIDDMNLLKARAIYTLEQKATAKQT